MIQLRLRGVACASCVVIAAAVLGLSDASGWGSVGHAFINRKAVIHLPGGMAIFIADSSLFAQHASDADTRKSSVPDEAPKHFIDIDDYPNFTTMPHSLDSLNALYTPARVTANGLVPWATVTAYDSLVAQLTRGEWTTAVLTASDLGHYVGDGHQPLHVTVNYDGQSTGNGGIHSRYETSMLSSQNFGSKLSVTPAQTSYITHRLDFVFAYLIHSNAMVDSILHADTRAKAVSGWSGSGTAPSAYYAELWNNVCAMTNAQMQGATLSLASLWYSAWVDAGLISAMGVVAHGAGVPAEFHLEQNYPNPFNPTTIIRYILPVGATVRLTVLDVTGRVVTTLVEENESVGTHSVVFNASGLASGVYFSRLQVGNFEQVKKMLLVR